MIKQIKELSRLTEEELLFELTSQIGDLAPYYADRFAQRAKKEVFDAIQQKFKEDRIHNGKIIGYWIESISDEDWETLKQQHLFQLRQLRKI